MDPQSIDRIYWDAAQIASTEDRQAYLDRACAGDTLLRQKVEKLLEVRSQAEDYLESPAAALVSTLDDPITERPGTVIGPYKLLEQIGEGGFGVVFMAEQQQPIRRKVALKVLKPGMDTRQVIARFEAERQALALMDHPNIAKVLDAGQTPPVSPPCEGGEWRGGGRPYFVMELVRGLPITDYCDQTQLTPRERLELFVSVCQAVQHAHQKGIIHRDIKPTNVLVTPPASPPCEGGGSKGGSQGDRLRHCQGAGPAAHGQDLGHRLCPDGRHAAVHVARAGGPEWARRGYAQ